MTDPPDAKGSISPIEASVLAQVASLAPDVQLTWALGDIVRNDAFAEGEAKALFLALSTGPAEPQRDFSRVLKDCRRLATDVPLPDFLRTLCFEVMSGASDAHRLRNDLAHDRWMHVPTAREAAWSSAPLTPAKHPRPTRRTLQEFTGCSAALNRVGWRLRALRLLVPSWLGGPDEFEYAPDGRARWTAIARGAFTYGDGGLRVPGEE